MNKRFLITIDKVERLTTDTTIPDTASNTLYGLQLIGEFGHHEFISRFYRELEPLLAYWHLDEVSKLQKKTFQILPSLGLRNGFLVLVEHARHGDEFTPERHQEIYQLLLDELSMIYTSALIPVGEVELIQLVSRYYAAL